MGLEQSNTDGTIIRKNISLCFCAVYIVHTSPEGQTDDAFFLKKPVLPNKIDGLTYRTILVDILLIPCIFTCPCRARKNMEIRKYNMRGYFAGCTEEMST